MQNDFYVYILFRPWDGSPCYVGKGKGKRWLVHERHRYGCVNQRLARIIKKAGGFLPKTKIAEGLSEPEAFDVEKSWIALVGRGDAGPLVNMTKGGEGTSGIVISHERRAATSKRHSGKKVSPEHLAILTKNAAERIWTDASREKIRLSKLGKVRSRETVAKMSAATKLHMMDPARKAAVATANAARVWTPEMRAAHSRRMAQVAEQRAAASR